MTGIYSMGNPKPRGILDEIPRYKVVYLENELEVPANMSLANVKVSMATVFPEIRAMEPYLKEGEIHFRHPSERESYRKAAAQIEKEVKEIQLKKAEEREEARRNAPKELKKKYTDLGFIFVYVAKTKTIHQLFTGDLSRDEIVAACHRLDPDNTEVKLRSDYITDASYEHRTSLYIVEHGGYTFSSEIRDRVERILQEEVGLDGQWVVASGSAMKKCGTAGGLIPHARIKCVQVLKELDLAIVQLHYDHGKLSEPMLVDATELTLKRR